jgi:8-oxo-dGTP diphosphatase
MTERPVLHIASAIIRRSDEILMVLQAGPGEEPVWTVPGGALDDGELITETLTREILEETGLEIEVPARVAFVVQIDNRRLEQLHASRGPGNGYLATVWTFDVEAWSGELAPRDPDGHVSEAAWVPLAEAAERIRHVPWLALTSAYLRGELEAGSVHCLRWHGDGTVETVA